MTENELMLRCLDLDLKRKAAAGLKAELEDLADLVIGELRRRKLDRFDFLPDRAALLGRATATTIDVRRFRIACVHANLEPQAIEAAIQSKVLVGSAKALLGADALDRLSDKTSGAWSVKIVSAAR